MLFDDLLRKFKAYGKADAIIWHDKPYSYEWLYQEIEKSKQEILDHQITPGEIVEINADYSPKAVAILLALVSMQCITVPLSKSSQQNAGRFREIAQVEAEITLDVHDNAQYKHFTKKVDHPILLKLKRGHHPGLILFSSGSTGASKAAVHDWRFLLERYRKPALAKRVIVFLLFDHIGGVNSLLHTLFNGGCVVVIKERTPQATCEVIQNHRVQVLPTSPTFLNLMLISHVYEKYDLGSLELVTYGTEVMPENVLKKFHELFPSVRLLQTYGLSEIGILKTESKSADSLFIKIKGEQNNIRIVNNLLEIKTKTAMIGYLNAEHPFTNDGWFKTGDMVEVDGDYIRILGRASEMINVGGLKIFPAQVENIIEQIENVEDVIVTSEKSPVTGNIVKATIKLIQPENMVDFRKKMIRFCKGKLETFAIPQKIVFVDKMPYGERFKKMHKAA